MCNWSLLYIRPLIIHFLDAIVYFLDVTSIAFGVQYIDQLVDSSHRKHEEQNMGGVTCEVRVVCQEVTGFTAHGIVT